MSKLTPSQQAEADQQVDRIVKMMTEKRWRGMASRRLLSKEWGIHERTVGYRAMEASAILKRIGTTLEQFVDEKMAELEDIQAAAMNQQRAIVLGKGEDASVEMIDEPQLDIARKAVMDQLTVRGVVGPAKRTTAPVDEASKDYATMTPAERIEAHRSAIAEEEARLADEQRNQKGGVH